MLRNLLPLHRIIALSFAAVLALGGVAALAVSSNSPSGTTFYACLANQTGSLYNVTPGEEPDCRNRDTLIHWFSYADTDLDAAYVNEGQENSISTGMIQNAAVTTDKLADESVTTAKLGEGSVVTAKLAADSVTVDKLADESVITAKIADGSVTEDKLADGNVTTAKLADGSVTTPKLANNSVTAAKVDSGSVQERVTGTCPPGQAVQHINSDGSVECAGTLREVSTYKTDFTRTISSGSTLSQTVYCAGSDLAISGGAQRQSGASLRHLQMAGSYQSSDIGWTTVVRNRHSTSSMTVRFSVVCMTQW